MATVNFSSERVNNNSVANNILNTYAQGVAWTGIKGSKSFRTPVTINEAVDAIGANYNVEKQHLIRLSKSEFNAFQSGESLQLSAKQLIHSHMATVLAESNTTLGVVGTGYGVVQNSKAFEFIDIITSGELGGEQKAVIETAGILNGGARMYISAKMPSSLYIGEDKNDSISDYIVFTNTHDGTGGVMAFFTPVRVICQNTLNFAIKTTKNKLVFKHTSMVNTRLDFTKQENMQRAIETLKMHELFKDTFICKLNELASVKLTGKDAVQRFAASVFTTGTQLQILEKHGFHNLGDVEELSTRTKNNITALSNAIESGIGQDKHRGSKLWLLNGLTTYISNEKKFGNTEDKLSSIMEGDSLRKVQKAYEYLSAI